MSNPKAKLSHAASTLFLAGRCVSPLASPPAPRPRLFLEAALPGDALEERRGETCLRVAMCQLHQKSDGGGGSGR